jgi:hypothetical protein
MRRKICRGSWEDFTATIADYRSNGGSAIGIERTVMQSAERKRNFV